MWPNTEFCHVWFCVRGRKGKFFVSSLRPIRAFVSSRCLLPNAVAFHASRLGVAGAVPRRPSLLDGPPLRPLRSPFSSQYVVVQPEFLKSGIKRLVTAIYRSYVEVFCPPRWGFFPQSNIHLIPGGLADSTLHSESPLKRPPGSSRILPLLPRNHISTLRIPVSSSKRSSHKVHLRHVSAVPELGGREGRDCRLLGASRPRNVRVYRAQISLCWQKEERSRLE